MIAAGGKLLSDVFVPQALLEQLAQEPEHGPVERELIGPLNRPGELELRRVTAFPVDGQAHPLGIAFDFQLHALNQCTHQLLPELVSHIGGVPECGDVGTAFPDLSLLLGPQFWWGLEAKLPVSFFKFFHPQQSLLPGSLESASDQAVFWVRFLVALLAKARLVASLLYFLITLMVAHGVYTLLSQFFYLIAASRIEHRESPMLIRSAAVIAMLPVRPMVVFSWPVAIWLWLSLNHPDVDRAFRERAVEPETLAKRLRVAGSRRGRGAQQCCRDAGR